MSLARLHSLTISVRPMPSALPVLLPICFVTRVGWVLSRSRIGWCVCHGERAPGSASGSSRFVFFQAEDGIRVGTVTGVQTCALPIWVAGTDPDEVWHATHLAD